MKDIANYRLKAHNTFGMDVACRRFLEYTSEEEARMAASVLRTAEEPFLIIGGGSNLLLTHDFEGIVVRSAMRGMNMTEHPDAFVACCASGERWDDVVDWSVANGVGCLVNLSLIPGDVGASAVQNIGAYGAEVAHYIQEIKAVEIDTGEQVVIRQEDCAYGYRDSRFKHEWKNRYLITQVSYRLPKNETLNTAYGNIREELLRQGIGQPTARQLRQTVMAIRRAKLPDPLEEGNAGSFFTNPVVGSDVFKRLLSQYPQMPHYIIDDDCVKIPAGWLIEQCGWKGRTMGRAGVHARQALVLVNRGGATGQDIVDLSNAIRQDVRRKFGIEIYPEVNIV